MALAAGTSFLHNVAGALWTTQSKAAAEATALAAGGVGMGFWSWNRGYYGYDAKQRWARFNFMNNMAIAQTGQFREDIEDLAQLTSNRMDNYHIVGVMALTIVTALFCPGRLGLHTPPPPSWLIGLFMCNLAGAYLWLGMTMWMAMHASLRADSAAAHMLTRMVRLPVPSQRQLDRARRLFSSWEYQPIRELFRVPIFMSHGTTGERVAGDQPPEDDEAHGRVRCEYDVPAWFRDERKVDEGRPIETFMPRSARGTAPEHFEVFRVIQCEYWPYDIYARICMFLAWMHLTSAWSHYQFGHTIQEIRAPFASGCVAICLFMTQHILITLDIKHVGAGAIPLERLGPFAILFSYVANLLEYQRWFSEAGLYISAFLIFLAYICTIVYTAQLLRLCSPDWEKTPEASESPGAAWWPSHWRIPSRWSHAVWLVAPPKYLSAGEVDLTDELRKSTMARHPTRQPGEPCVDPTYGEMAKDKQGEFDLNDKKHDIHRAFGKNNENPAWFFVKTGLSGLLIAWIWLLFGYFIDIVNEGTTHPSLLNAPGLPNNLRDPRNRPPKPGYKCVYGMEPWKECFGQEVGTGGYYAGPAHEQIHMQIANEAETGGHARRLSSGDARKQLSEKIRDLLPHLKHVILDRDDSRHHPFGEKSVPALETAVEAIPRAKVEWPALFEPRLLACGPQKESGAAHVAAALSRHGRGALVTGAAETAETSPFVLEGTATFGPFSAAHWDDAGLLLASASGSLLECPGKPSDGRWRCQPLVAEKLPVGPVAEPFAGALGIARRPSQAGSQDTTTLFAAVVFPGELSVTLFRKAGSTWLPAGEARTASQAVAVAFDEEASSLLLLLSDGSVARTRLADGATALAAEAVVGPAHTWQATCGLAGGKVARLGVRSSGAATWEPSLIFGA